jgi:murein DD-endopeptidase MepM/ murein hydrolase activator NlpD
LHDVTVGIRRALARLRADDSNAHRAHDTDADGRDRPAATPPDEPRQRSAPRLRAMRRPRGLPVGPVLGAGLTAALFVASAAGSISAAQPTGPIGDTSGQGVAPRLAVGGPFAGPVIGQVQPRPTDAAYSFRPIVITPPASTSPGVQSNRSVESQRSAAGLSASRPGAPVGGLGNVLGSIADPLASADGLLHADPADEMDLPRTLTPSPLTPTAAPAASTAAKPSSAKAPSHRAAPAPKRAAARVVKVAPKPTVQKAAARPTRVVRTFVATGRWVWPVVGGHNFVSRGFSGSHGAVDIAADFGTKVVAAQAGRVTFAGWKSNGGGYQVWVAHGNGIFTTYNHMSAITVGSGEVVARGQQVGRVGATGNATGPHLHFEVWRGPVWDGGERVNPRGFV